MNIKRLFVALVFGTGLILGVLWLLAGAQPVVRADPGVLHVAPGGSCGGPPLCYASVQDAVDVAISGDVIKVAQGDYTGVHVRDGITQVVYISKTVTVRGGYTTSDWNTSNPTAYPTTLDAQGQGRVVVLSGGISPTIEGLRITGGDAAGLGGHYGADVGGGVYVVNASATISGNQIFSNTANSGGGVCLQSSDANLSYNVVFGNIANNGDGLYLHASPATLSNNVIRDNGDSVSGWGGGIYMASSAATLRENTVAGNTGGYGSGVNIHGGVAVLQGNIITGNTGYRGGGLYLYTGSATISDTVITGNTVNDQGAGVYFWNNSSTLVNTVVADNHLSSGVGAGLYLSGASAPRLLHVTIARNSGGDGSGVHVAHWAPPAYSNVAMTNTIIFSHTVGVMATAGNTATLDATLWHANGTDWGGAGTINHTNDHSGAPAFAADGYHLTGDSAAIDRGVNAGVTTDIDGETRPIGSRYDLGADETDKEYVIYAPLVMRN